LVIDVKFAFQPVELRIGERRSTDDESAGGARRVVEQRLVPGSRRVVDVERGRRRFHGRQAVMIVGRMEEGQMQDRRHRFVRLLREADRLPADRIIVGYGPTVGSRHHAHPVGPQRVQFARRAIDQDSLHIGVSGHEQVTIDAFEKTLSALTGIRVSQKGQKRMRDELPCSAFQRQRKRGRRLGDKSHRPVHDGVLLKSLARQSRIIAWRPNGMACHVKRNGSLGARGLGLRRSLKPAG
jgi:hypothetical protein